MDGQLTEHDRLQGAHRGMESLLDSAGNILSNLREQKGVLKVVTKYKLCARENITV